MGWHLDGRVTAVVGTHTHVPDRRRAGAARRDRLHHRRRDDRPARRRDRRQARPGRELDGHPDADPVRDLDEDPWLNAVSSGPTRRARGRRSSRCSCRRRVWSSGPAVRPAGRGAAHSAIGRSARAPAHGSCALTGSGSLGWRAAAIARRLGAWPSRLAQTPGQRLARVGRRWRGSGGAGDGGACGPGGLACTAAASAWPSSRREAAEQRHHERRVEPDDVGVQPVADPELEHDQDRGAERGHLDQAPPPRGRP